MSEYYVAPVGEVYRAALPGLLANADASVVTLTEAGERARTDGDAPLLSFDAASIDAPHRRLLEAVATAGAAGLAVGKLPRLRPRIPGALARLAELERDGLVATQWSDEGASTRTETFVRRTGFLRGDEESLQRLVRRSKQ